MPKGFQNGSKIDTKTHQESMPKLVTKKIGKIIKNHVSLNGKIIGIHCKTNIFDGLEGCMCARWSIQKNIKNDTKMHPQIDEQSIQISCSKRGYQKDRKSSKLGSKSNWKISKNSNKHKTNKNRKQEGKKATGLERGRAERRREHYKVKDRR